MTIMQDLAPILKSLRRPRTAIAPTMMLACALNLGGCAVGPEFARPTPPAAARYTSDTLRAEDATKGDTVQHIAFGQEIEGNWWTLFHSDAIDQLVTQALDHNRSLAASMATLAQAQELPLLGEGGRLREPLARLLDLLAQRLALVLQVVGGNGEAVAQ